MRCCIFWYYSSTPTLLLSPLVEELFYEVLHDRGVLS